MRFGGLLGKIVSSSTFTGTRKSQPPFLPHSQRHFTTFPIMMATTTTTPTSRTVAQTIPATSSGPIWRLVGTVDIDGRGTEHPLEAVDPFMLLDYATIPQPDLPPFGAHPHRGHSVVTVLLQGNVKSWDSFSNVETVVTGPASYWVDAGSGLFHDEVSVMDDAGDPNQHVKLLQLWVSVKEADRLQAPRVQYDTDLPTVDAVNPDGKMIGSIRYHVGGGANIETPHPVVVAHITQNAGTTLHFPVDPTFGGFVTNIQGDMTVGSNDASATSNKAFEVLVLEDSQSDKESYLEITTSSAAEYLVSVGEKVHEEWYKKLAASGAIIAKTPQEAREIASQIEVASNKGKETGDFSPFGAPAAPKS